jgi:hypothetical protein
VFAVDCRMGALAKKNRDGYQLDDLFDELFV